MSSLVLSEGVISTMRRPASTSAQRASPAKLNLRLAVTGRREDGFHELRSIVVPIDLCDQLSVRWHDAPGETRLAITGADLAPDEDNLVLRAVRLFAEAHPFPGHLEIALQKNIPLGAGLGGGSSNAATTLRCLQTLWGEPLPPGQLAAIARRLGADVPFFLRPECAIMRGLGEQLEPVPALAHRLAGRPLLVFKPWAGIQTKWAYAALAARRAYQSVDEEERLLARWEAVDWPLAELPFNAFRAVVDHRLPSLPTLLAALNRLPGIQAEMSGSGSACFALGASEDALAAAAREIRLGWGESVFMHRARVP